MSDRGLSAAGGRDDGRRLTLSPTAIVTVRSARKGATVKIKDIDNENRPQNR